VERIDEIVGYLDYGECGEYAKSVAKSENMSDMNDSNEIENL
jgi:hypothetical protein